MSDEENKERNMSEVILSIEDNVKQVLAVFKTIALTNTIILDKLNKLSLPPSSDIIIEKPAPTPINKIMGNNFSGEAIIPELPVKKPKIEPKQEVFQEVKQEHTQELKTEKHSLSKEENKSKRKIPVTQLVLSKENKKIFMAVFEIFDSSGSIIDKGKTNAEGKWQKLLPPGMYKFKISKNIINKETKATNLVSKEFDFAVETDKEVVNLPNLIIDK